MLLLLMLVAFTTASCQDTEKAGFYKGSVDTSMPIESKYKEKGSEEVAKAEYDSDDATIGKIVVVYPHSLLKSDGALPLVNIGNASNTTAYDLIEAMEHLASWGFVVIGNMDKQTGTGASMSHTLDAFLTLVAQQDNQFYGRIDTTKIAIAGYSQGAFGAVMAATAYPNSRMYKAVYLCSCPQKQIGINFKWGTSDFSKIGAPLLMVAGTGDWDSKIISPEEAFQANFKETADDFPVLAARHAYKDHEEMGGEGDPYMTAWFCHYLKGDSSAGKAFVGDDAEILKNTGRWINIERKNL
ncbi:MAG: hypothetical protein K6G92_05385 [Bacteroidaceae bacterium]|nr:hypothetical protein [Bacteroidaceae bacterium]